MIQIPHIWTQSVTQHQRQHKMQPPLRFHPPRPPTPARSTERKLENHMTFSDFLHLLRCSKNSKNSKDLLLLALAAAAKRGSLGPAKPSSFAASQFSTLFGGKNSATSGDANCGMTLEWYWLGIWNHLKQRDFESKGCFFIGSCRQFLHINIYHVKVASIMFSFSIVVVHEKCQSSVESKHLPSSSVRSTAVHQANKCEVALLIVFACLSEPIGLWQLSFASCAP